MSKTVPTWGYNAEGGRLFELAPGEALPPGFVDSPAKVEAAKPNSVSDTPNSVTESPADEFGMLKEKAAALGIVLRGRLSVDRLKAAIAAVEDDGDTDE